MDDSDNHLKTAAVQRGRFPGSEAPLGNCGINYARARLLTVPGFPLGDYDSRSTPLQLLSVALLRLRTVRARLDAPRRRRSFSTWRWADDGDNGAHDGFGALASRRQQATRTHRPAKQNSMFVGFETLAHGGNPN
ncbi:hypothetical protein DL767_000497 [Monosporascus sp. MG133]|nr:hypothetical protein DL767_000497 [Monosporascus sp. MG133]